MAQPGWANANVSDVRVFGSLLAVGVLVEVGTQAALTLAAGEDISDPFALHGHLIV